MAKLTIVNNIDKWKDKKDNALNLLLSAMGVDILRLSKQQVPLKKGQLSSAGILKPEGTHKYSIKFNKKYASYQHRGSRRDGTRVVRNYSTAGRKSKYLSDPADTIWGNKKAYIQRYL